jgi:hypothetical protein
MMAKSGVMTAGSIQPKAHEIVDMDDTHRLLQTGQWVFHYKGRADLMVIEENQSFVSKHVRRDNFWGWGHNLMGTSGTQDTEVAAQIAIGDHTQ